MGVVELPDLPNLGPLYARSLKAMLPLPGDRPESLPDRTVGVADVEVTADEVADYGRVCGFGLADAVPLTFPHMLAFPLSVHLMVADDFPFALPGLVHVAQRIEQTDPVRIGDHLDVRVRTTDLRPHKRGRQFDVVAEVDRDGQTVWTGTSTYLRRGSDGEAAGTSPADTPEPPEPDGPPTSTWRLPKDLGKRYAKVSGDVNPIHLSPLTSRLGGFAKPIAHGMWTAARSVAALTDRIAGPATLDVAFKQPVPLPSTVALRSRRTADGWTFTLHDRSGRRLHLNGRLDAPSDRSSKDQ
ncbi:MAG: MaoC/PaaZ C-terminal domain-containing protein [Egicoccus sp.]